MLRNVFFLAFCALTFSFPLVAETAKIEAFTTYSGDEQGCYCGDTALLLSDGSAWKVHPEQTEEICQWRVGDDIRVSLRKKTLLFFLKSSHRFLLINQSLGETAKAMVVGQGESPLLVINSSEVYTTLQTGAESYEKTLYLSDGTIWQIHDSFNIFKAGTSVLKGCKESDDEAFTFLIAGVGRSACWTKAKRDRRIEEWTKQ